MSSFQQKTIGIYLSHIILVCFLLDFVNIPLHDLVKTIILLSQTYSKVKKFANLVQSVVYCIFFYKTIEELVSK
jgi:hypothetical protein